MKTIINYAKEETRSFKVFTFNDVDSLILSTLSYINFTDIVPNIKNHKRGVILENLSMDLIKNGVKKLADAKLHLKLFAAIMHNPRFKDLRLNNYVEIIDLVKETHFCAMTFKCDLFCYLAYMGTSASLIDWKEDFNMAYMTPVPAQKYALKYLNKVMSYTPGYIYIGGHSKGGNLAIYSAVNTYFWNKFRIKKVFTHDGPGFTKKFFNSVKYDLIRPKISKTVPSSSIVGMLMYSRENYRVVKSNALGILQHSSFTWQITNSNFLYLQDLAWDSKYFDRTISDWLNSVTDEEKNLFINTMYNILNAVDYSTIDVTKNNWWNIYKTIKAGKAKLDPETKKKIDEIFKKLAYYQKMNLFPKKSQ